MREIYKVANIFINKFSSKDFLYHVTFYKHLPKISNEGLRPNAGEVSAGRVSNAEYSKGNLFFTEFGGLAYWFDKIVDVAFEKSDDYIEDGYIPVVLRVPYKKYKVDDVGTSDASRSNENAKAFKVRNKISEEKIEIYSGVNWTNINNFESINISDGVDEYGYLKDSKNSSLFPKL